MKYRPNLHLLAVSLLLLLLTACGSLKEYEAATSYFNQGATIEMKNRMGDTSSAETESLASLQDLYPPSKAPVESIGNQPKAYYEAALLKANAALAKPQTLEKNNVLGNALIIKSLAQWQLGQYTAAEKTAAEALPILKKAPRNERSDRDEAMAIAIPGLVALDAVYDTLQFVNQLLRLQTEQLSNASTSANSDLLEFVKRHYKQFILDEPAGGYSTLMALNVIGSSIPTAKRNKEVHQYLVLAQLAGIKTWYDAYSNLSNFSRLAGLAAADPDIVAWNKAERERYIKTRNQLMEELKALLNGGENHKIYKYWDELL